MLNIFDKTNRALLVIALAAILLTATIGVGRHLAAPQNQGASPAPEQWEDAFDGDALDAAKWESFAVEGNAAQAKVENGHPANPPGSPGAPR